ncbi:hypothetical protein P171DRAFT_520432 [Karstenula rhodostoma CBS 690.94]|uniref:Uncharacterized protein n=1 Tax=Karstenula rhodostoma CBS 690.94 TaxID=1392251 RepID=A0A9P4PKI7_9PLEO|nr:hypothetical protein P171DRAFT_520432 [Karstenula rhodostoma CBS 690.94]
MTHRNAGEIEDEVLAGCDDKITEEERELGVDKPPELEAKTEEGLLLPDEDVMDELKLDMSELVVLEVKLTDDVVLTNTGGEGGGFTAGLVTAVVVADAELKGTVEVLVKITVVDVELGDVVAKDGKPLEIVKVTVELGAVLCKTVEGVT